MDLLRKSPELIYGCRDISVAPYPTSTILAEGYLRFEREGLTDIIFHECPTDIAWFLTHYIVKMNAILALIQGSDLIGFAWFNYKQNIGVTDAKKAEAGIAFFRKTKPSAALMACAIATHWAFDNLDVDVILGVTPERNRPAVRFFKKLGREFYGPIPYYTCYPNEDGTHSPCGAYISAMTKTNWGAVQRQFFQEEDY